MTKNKTKSVALLLMSLMFEGMSYAQSIAPQSVNSAGTRMSQNNGSLNYTVGELVVLTHIDSYGNELGSGFTIAAVLTTKSIQEPDARVLSVKVFPNPTTELLNIQIDHSTLEHLLISIYDLQGKEVFKGKYTAISNSIGVNMATYPSGTYVLSLKNKNNEVLGTYKIIKQ